MSTWLGRWFGYGLGAAAGKAIFGEEPRGAAARAPIRAQTEEEILADEKRFQQEEKMLEAQTAAERAAKKDAETTSKKAARAQ